MARWFTWNDGWIVCNDVPKPNGVWTGIGTRKLEVNGKEAIRSLMGWDKPSVADLPQ